ncbi:MAG: hypothetical protein ABSH28_11935, partial [Acidobacteriota bacterium]
LRIKKTSAGPSFILPIPTQNKKAIPRVNNKSQVTVTCDDMKGIYVIHGGHFLVCEVMMCSSILQPFSGAQVLPLHNARLGELRSIHSVTLVARNRSLSATHSLNPKGRHCLGGLSW